MIEFNINYFIKVKLTKYGREIHEAHFRQHLYYNAAIGEPDYSAPVDEKGFTKYQLWEFMNIFGGYMHNGAKLIIQRNMIYFE